MAAHPPLPDYAPMLRAFHQGFATELEAMVATLPIQPGDRVLEVACGDGAYTPWLAGRAGDAGLVVGLDLSSNFLRLARREVARTEQEAPESSATELVAGSIERLPFPPASFDVVWCAQSLFSLPEPLDAVARMAQMARAGGLVAVLEDDTLHQVLLPWPVDLELAVRTAEWEALNEQTEHPRKFYIGRRLVDLFHQAGLVELRVRTFVADRMAPLDPSTRTFFAEYLQQIRANVSSRLAPKVRDEFERRVDPASNDYLLDSPTLAATVIDHVVQGRKP